MPAALCPVLPAQFGTFPIQTHIQKCNFHLQVLKHLCCFKIILGEELEWMISQKGRNILYFSAVAPFPTDLSVFYIKS